MSRQNWRKSLSKYSRKRVSAEKSARLRLEQLEERSLLATFAVLNTNDSGPDSLREAITLANGDAVADLISFNIPGTGPHVIAPLTALPGIVNPVTIDGYTQPGSSRNTLANGNDAVLRVELDGSSAGSGAHGLFFTAGNSRVSGLAINRFSGDGIRLETLGGNMIEGNFIGTDVTGTLARGNGTSGIGQTAQVFNEFVPGFGIEIIGGSSSNIVGTNGDNVGDVGERNVISSNIKADVFISGVGTNGNVVAGNYIGTNAAGTDTFGQVAQGAFNYNVGVFINGGPQSNRIGTDGNGVADIAERNIISGHFGNTNRPDDHHSSRGVEISNLSTVPSVGLNIVAGNYVGTDVTGTRDLGNGVGIGMQVSNQNRIGTNSDGLSDAVERNLVSGNGFGIHLFASHQNTVAGNYVGTDVTGTTNTDLVTGDLGSSTGIWLLSSSSNTVGGTAPGAGNLVSGNTYYGIQIQGNNNPVDSGADHNTVQGNLVGTDVTGTLALGNGGYGIYVNSNGNLIGGATASARNLVSANGNGVGGDGIAVIGYSNVLQGNYVGTDITGTLNLGNMGPAQFLLGNGINITGGSGNQIGGTAAGQGNLIAYNKGSGVMVTGATQVGNSISGNSIHTNDRLGIDLTSVYPGTPGPNANDPNDVDVGPNDFQNFPLLASVGSNVSGTTIAGTLNSTPLTTFRLDFYANPATDPSGFGEGKTYLGSAAVTTDLNGDVTYTVTVSGVAPIGQFVSATATDPSGNTSEFSSNTTVVSGNTAPNSLSLNAGAISENDIFTLTGTFTDADALDAHTVTINWGEGAPEVHVLPMGTRSFSFDHQYLDDNPTLTGADVYSVGVSVSDGTASTSTGTDVTVTNVAPSNVSLSVSDLHINEDQSTSVSGTFADPGTLDAHKVTINWGEGAPEVHVLPVGARSFNFSHKYLDDNPTNTSSDQHHVTVTVSDDDGGSESTAAAYAPAVLTDAPILYWRLGESSGSTATNLGSLGSAADGTYTAGPVLGVSGATPDGNTAVRLGDTDGSRVVKSSLAFPTTSVSVEFWVNTSATNNGNPFSYASTSHHNEFLVSENCGVLRIRGQVINTGVNVEDGKWHHIAVTWQSSDGAVRMYKDGVLVFSGTYQAGAALTSGGTLMLGQDQDVVGGNLDPTQRFIGSMDEVALYDSVLSAAQVQAHFNAAAHLTVANVAPANLNWKVDNSVINEGQSTSVSGTFTDPGTLDVHIVTINWGDGAPINYTLPVGDRSFNISHTYTDDNPTITPQDVYSVSVSLSDDDSGVASALIYGLKSENAGTTARTRPPTHLFSFNSDGTGFNDLGTVLIGGTAIDVDALAFSPQHGLLAYQLHHATPTTPVTGSTLLSINPVTAAATSIGSTLSGRDLRAAVFDPAGRLFVLDAEQNELLEIDPTNGQILGIPIALTLGGIPHDLTDLTDLSVRSDGTFYVVDSTVAVPGDPANSIFYTLNPATGALTFLYEDTVPQATSSFTGSSGLAFTRASSNTLLTYEANGVEDIFRYDLTAGFARTLVLGNIIPLHNGVAFNAGRGDLAAFVNDPQITVRNLNPVINTLAATSVFENGTVTLTGTYHDAGTLDTHTLTINWGEGTPQIVPVSGGSFSFTHQYLDDNPTATASDNYTIGVTLTDDDTGVATRSTAATITNVAPDLATLANSSPNVGDAAAGEAVTIAGTFTDLGRLDTHTVLINWGDGHTTPGTVTESNGSGSFAGSHVYSSGGIFNISVTLKDDDSGTETLVTTAIVSGVGLTPDGELQIIGTDGRDIFSIVRDRRGGSDGDCDNGGHGGQDLIRVSTRFDLSCSGCGSHGGSDGGSDRGHDHDGSHGKSRGGSDGGSDGGRDGHSHRGGSSFTFNAADVQSIRVVLGGCDDSLSIDEGISVPAFVDGGEGNDKIESGSGNDTIVDLFGNNEIDAGAGHDTVTTGSGNDEIDGKSGDDVILAGAGNDKVDAGSGDDIVVGGDGNDELGGGNGLDLLIGGRGADRISGDGAEDLLIASFTDFDANVVALDTIMAEWSSAAAYATRVANLISGGGSLAGLGVLLNDTTVHDDNAFDDISGNDDRDLFFYNFEGPGVRDRARDLKTSGNKAETRVDLD